MAIKTSANIKESQFVTITSISSQYNITMSFIINSLIKISMKKNSYKTRVLKRVQYQERLSVENDFWHCLPVSLSGDIYEKCQDMKKLYKLSVSFIISDAIDFYLEQFIDELVGKAKIESDNYTTDYLIFHNKTGYAYSITLLWCIPDQKKLKKIKEIHT